MTPIVRNITIWRGNTKSLAYRFLDGAGDPAVADLVGSTFVLRILAGTTQLYRAEATPDDDARITFAFTPVQSRAIPLGTSAKYEIERRIGDAQETWFEGFVTGKGGVNDD